MTTLSAQPNTLHASLIHALAGPDPERALEQAFIQLSRGVSLPLLLEMIKALVHAGLAGIAARLLRCSNGLLTAEPRLASLADQLEQMPSGEMSSKTFQRHIQANVDALKTSHPNLHLNVESRRPVDLARIFVSAKGNHYVIRESMPGKLEFMFSFADQIAHATAAKLEHPVVGATFLLLGVPSVPLWRRLASLRSEVGYVPPIDVVETDEEVFATWLGLIDDADLLRGERFSFFVGSRAVEDYRSFLMSTPTRQPATSTITSIRPRWQTPQVDGSFHEQISRSHRDRQTAIKHKLDDWYSNKDVLYWRNRFATAGKSSPPLRIAGLTSRFSTVMQHAMRDLASAFKRQGCQFELVKQTADHIGVVDVVGELNRLRPDLIIVINHLRSELTDSIPSNVPYVCWIQDYMQQLWAKEAGASVGEFDLVLGHSPSVMTSVYGYPATRFLATHNLTSIETFSCEPVPAEDKAKYVCDLSYVGHGWETPEQLVDEIGRQNSRFGKYMGAVALLAQQRVKETGFITTQDLVSIVVQAERDSGHSALSPETRRALVVPSAQRIIDRILRHQTLQWAADWAMSRKKSFRLFGNGWERHAALRQYASGAVEHGYALRCAFQASTISLQVNGYGSLHQRLLDAIASGAFMLTRFNPADFIRGPHLAIKTYIDSNAIADLPSLLAHAGRAPALQASISRAEQLTGTRIAPTTDPERARHVADHLQCASLSERDFSDEGLFSVLRDLVSVPHRTASDIDGFAETTFRSREQMHEMLDRFGSDGNRRHSLVARMRHSVLEHDTYESLVAAVLDAWRDRFRTGAMT
jgi:hypothetical protein